MISNTRTCRSCGVTFDMDKHLGKNAKGTLCGICIKYHKLEYNRWYYHNCYDKGNRLADPERKVCSECNKVFYGVDYRIKTCCKECSKNRKKRLRKGLISENM